MVNIIQIIVIVCCLGGALFYRQALREEEAKNVSLQRQLELSRHSLSDLSNKCAHDVRMFEHELYGERGSSRESGTRKIVQDKSRSRPTRNRRGVSTDADAYERRCRAATRTIRGILNEPS